MALIQTKQVAGLDTSLSSLDTYIDSVSGDLSTEIAATNADVTGLSEDVFSLDAYVDSVSGDLSTEIAATDSEVSGLISREIYGDDRVSGLSAGANTNLVVTFSGQAFYDAPYDYSIFINGLQIGFGNIITPLTANAVEVNLPYDVDAADVFTIKGIVQ